MAAEPLYSIELAQEKEVWTETMRLQPVLRRFLLIPMTMAAFTLAVAAQQNPGSTTPVQGPRAITPAMEQKVDAMVHKLTLEQKIALIGGEDNMYIRSEPGIGLPRLKMSDGPMGVRTWGPSTAYAAGINLAASWDPTLARKIGVMLGDDARARGVNFLLGPGVNIYRSPRNGRNFEYFGEDPYLAGQIAVQYIDGVQSQGVIATVKHFAANNAEYDRHNINSIVDERALREIYLPAFEAAVKQGHAGAVMDSYNLLNGQHSTQNRFLNIDVLRKDWGFRGIVMSDWFATYDGVAAARNGLDLEMPSGAFMNAKTLLPAIQSGRLPESVIDAKVRRILRTAMQFGFFDRDQTDLNIPLFNQQGNAVALQAAEEGAVLLKNDGHLLPLDRHSIHSIAVLGPDAYPARPGAGGSSNVTAFAPVSFMTGLSDALYPGIKVYWNSGIPSPSTIFSDSHWCVDAACKQTGLARDEYIVATNAKVFSGLDPHVSHWTGGQWGMHAKTPRRVEWSGYFVPKTSGIYRFVAAGMGEDQYQLMVNGKQILEEKHFEGQAPKAAKVTLQAGQPAQVKLIYFPITDQVTAGLGVIAEDKLINPEAIRLARMADAVVLSVGFGPHTESEGFDRTYHLPFGQQALIRAVAAANPHTIVTLTAGGSVATSDWISQVPALLQTWYAGQQGGAALARLVFGDIDPSGKLPITWQKDFDQDPIAKNYYEQPGSHDVKYSEGLFVGYRYYDKSEKKPLFPFGYGLSYTNFAFSNLSVSPEAASPDAPITVSFDVKNTGSRAGAEVAQVYVGDPSAAVPRPVKELKGFSRVELQPGEQRRVSVSLDRRSLAYWSTDTHGWKVDPGKFVVYVGNSSENVPLRKSFTVK